VAKRGKRTMSEKVRNATGKMAKTVTGKMEKGSKAPVVYPKSGTPRVKPKASTKRVTYERVNRPKKR